MRPTRVTLWLAIALAGGALSSCGGSSSGAVSSPPAYPNGDLSNTRYTSSPIDSSNVSKLTVAWTLPLTAQAPYGAYSASPVISGGVVYSQDLESNVQAIDLKSGKVRWTHDFSSSDQGPNGVTFGDGRVYGATDTAAFALDAASGKLLWTVPLARNQHEGIDMAPGYHEGIMYISTVPGNANEFYKGEGVGILWALDARTGRRLWSFHTAPNDLWSAQNVPINSGGGVWYTPAFDAHGSMYVGTANPGPFPGTEQLPWGASRPGPDLYTDSIVKLDARTGRLEWYYQLSPHDLYDWDLQDPPILLESAGKQVVLAAGKGGIVIALDAASGQLLWKTPVGKHDGHDQDGLRALHGETSKLKLPETVYPGLLGGVIAPMASNGTTVFVPIVNHPVTISSQTVRSEQGPSNGEVVALDVATGRVRWVHRLPTPAFGAVSAVNDLVFATDFEGSLYALDAATGAVAWEAKLPAGTNTGVAVAGNTILAPAGAASAQGQVAEMTAFRLP